MARCSRGRRRAVHPGGGQFGDPAAVLSYGRDDERESDDLGVEYASLLGYDAARASEFFVTLRRLGEQSGQALPSFLSTHPDPGEREQTIRRLPPNSPCAAHGCNATPCSRESTES